MEQFKQDQKRFGLSPFTVKIRSHLSVPSNESVFIRKQQAVPKPNQTSAKFRKKNDLILFLVHHGNKVKTSWNL